MATGHWPRTAPVLIVAAFLWLNLATISAWAGEASPLVTAKAADFDPGAKIHVCWRTALPGNPFLVTGPFNCSAFIQAVDAPFPGGGVNGDQIMSVVEKNFSPDQITEIRIRSLEAGQPADNPSAGLMSVSRGTDEFYNNYVGRIEGDRLAVFLDIEVKSGE